MSGSRQRIYWDANCFLSFINQDPRWLPTLDLILEDANIHRTLEIVTSVLSITEVGLGRWRDSAGPSTHAKRHG